MAMSDDSFILFPITLHLSANNFRNKGMIFSATRMVIVIWMDKMS
jgi:hypothetical protein